MMMTDFFLLFYQALFYVYYLESSKQLAERVLFILPKNRRLLMLWNFPKATHLVRDGPGIHPQTGLPLKPTVILSS